MIIKYNYKRKKSNPFQINILNVFKTKKIKKPAFFLLLREAQAGVYIWIINILTTKIKGNFKQKKAPLFQHV